LTISKSYALLALVIKFG